MRQWGGLSHIWKVIKAMFETTNQLPYHHITYITYGFLGTGDCPIWMFKWRYSLPIAGWLARLGIRPMAILLGGHHFAYGRSPGSNRWRYVNVPYFWPYFGGISPEI